MKYFLTSGGLICLSEVPLIEGLLVLNDGRAYLTKKKKTDEGLI